MARSGRFGRAPRTAPSLTSTLIAIAREYQNQRDSNIMDAWQKGGMFEGKKVTDALVLAHWRERMNGVSKDDPLHDTYANAVTNLDYTIHESKMTAAYALGKQSDSAMVSFYLGWAKKVPKDSEFYRVLQRDAGQYIRSAKQLSQAKINQAKEERYQKQQAETSKQYEDAGNFLTDTMRRLNQSGYANGHVVNTIDAPDASSNSAGQDLTSFDPNDPEVSMQLLALIAPYSNTEQQIAPGVYMPGKGTYKANTAVLYHSDTIDPKTGKPKAVTGADILAELTKHDPNYKPGDPVDVSYLTGLLDRQNTGIQERIDRATKTGHMQDAAQLTKQKGYVANLTRQVAAWPVEKAYMDENATWQASKNDPSISPQALSAAWDRHVAALTGFMKDPRIASNDNMRTRLQAEIDGNDSVPTLGESFTGQDVNMTGYKSKETATSQGAVQQARDQMDAVAKSAALPDGDPSKIVWTYGTTGDDGVFHPNSNGTEIGAAPMAAVSAGGMMPQTVTIDDPKGGAGIKMVVTAAPVYGVAYDPVTGKQIPKQNNQPIAYAYNFPNGGTSSKKYGYLVKDPTDPTKSVMNFSESTNPPWNDKLNVSASSDGGNHYDVDFSPLLPTTASVSGGAPGSTQLNIDASKPGAVDGLPGFNVVDVPAATASNLKPTGTITFDPYAVSRASDTDRNALGGTDPTTDFISLTVANLLGSTDGQNIMRSLDQHPEFKTQVTTDTNTYAGVQYDAKGVMINPGDPSKIATATQQTNMATNSKNLVDFVQNGFKAWQRLTTGSPYPNSQPTGPAAGPNAGSTIADGTPLQKLATDLVKGTPFEAIAQHLFSGTLTTKPAPTGQDADKADFVINMSKAITVPGTPKTVTVSTKDMTQSPTSTVSMQQAPVSYANVGGGGSIKAI